MNKRYREFTDLGTTVLVVSFAAPETLELHVKDMGLKFPAASDKSRKAYVDYGLQRGSFFQVWHPSVIIKYVSLMFKGMKAKPPPVDEDLSQLGGDFIIDAKGRIAYAFTSTRPDDRPPVQDLLNSLKELG